MNRTHRCYQGPHRARADAQAERRTLQQTAKADSSKQDEGSSTAAFTQEASQDPLQENPAKPADADSADTSLPVPDIDVEADGAAAEGAHEACCDPPDVDEKVAYLAQYMPVLARTAVPCSDAVFAAHRTASQLQELASPRPAVAEHLTVFAEKPQQATLTVASSDSDLVRQIWGLPIANLDETMRKSQKGGSREKGTAGACRTSVGCLVGMPARKVTRDFMAVHSVAQQLPSHACGGVAEAAASLVYNAVWARIYALPSAAPARVWEQILTQPACMFARTLSAPNRWEAARSLQTLAGAQQALEKPAPQQLACASVPDSVPEPAEGASAVLQNQADSVSDTKQVSSHQSVWQVLSKGVTDADGQRAVRGAWAATTGLAKMSRATNRSSSKQKAAAAMLDLQLAVQDLGEKQPAERPKWGDHQALRAAVHAADCRFNAIKNLPPPLEGPLGPYSTPRWLASAAASKGGRAGTSPRTSRTSSELTALQSARESPEGLHAEVAHIWAHLGVNTAEQGAVSEAGDAAGGGSSQKLASVWSELLPPQPLGVSIDSSSSSQTEQESDPGPLRHYEFEEEVLFVFDSLASGEVPRVAGPCPGRDVTPIDGMGGQVWGSLLDDAAILAHRIKKVWANAREAAVDLEQLPVQNYSYPARALLQQRMSRRSAGALKAWATLQENSGQHNGSPSGGVGGSRFSVIRDSMDVAAQRSVGCSDQAQMPQANGSSKHNVSSTERLLWQKHCNQVAAAAARRLHARADRFRDVWSQWDESWLKSSTEVVEDEGTGGLHVPNIDVFSQLPEDSNAAFRR